MERRPRLTVVGTDATDKSPPDARQKGRGRPFPPGNSIGKAGRPKGSRNAAYVALEAIGTENAGDVLREVVKRALDGDLMACRIILDRTWPAPKGRLVPLAIPAIGNLADLAAAHSAVTQALADARITVDEAASLVTVLDHRRRLIETADIERRLTTLEEGLKKQ